MALISAATIIRSVALFHLTLAFFFLTSPSTISDQTLVFIIGQAMKLPATRAFDVQSGPLSLLAAVFGVSGISDLVAISMPDEIAMYHWSTQAPIRLAVFFIYTFYSFAFSAFSPLYSGKAYTPSTWGEGLKNRVVFTWGFVEMLAWFWVFVTIREERREMAIRQQRRTAAEADHF